MQWHEQTSMIENTTVYMAWFVVSIISRLDGLEEFVIRTVDVQRRIKYIFGNTKQIGSI